MPIPPLIPALIGSIIEGAAEQAPPQPPASTLPTVVRSIPADARFGIMAPPQPGVVEIDGQAMPLAMATQFLGENNINRFPGTIREPVPVRYLIDSTGTVWRVWILSAAEVAASR